MYQGMFLHLPEHPEALSSALLFLKTESYVFLCMYYARLRSLMDILTTILLYPVSTQCK